MSCERRDDAGAWVLGALDESDARRFAAHLETCDICAREVAELRMVADTLPLAAPQIAPPPELKERIMAAVRTEAAVLEAAGPEADIAPAAPPRAPVAEAPRERARKEPAATKRSWAWLRRPVLALRPLPAAALASALLALGVGAGVLVSGGGTSARVVQAQVVQPSAPAARASLTVSGDDRATLRVRNFPRPPSGRVYQVWVKRPGRAPAPTNALFDVRNGTATVAVPGSVEGVEAVLVTDEPGGGSRAPTRSPVIVAQPA
jgi:anti-sigma factor RsiW